MIANIVLQVSKDNCDSIVENFMPNLTACLDAIDEQNEKTAVIAAYVTKSIPIVTFGGAAGQSDPTLIICDDMIEVQYDRLLFKRRKQLRKFHGFPKGPRSGEKNDHGVSKCNIFLQYFQQNYKRKLISNMMLGVGSIRQCDSAFGSACFVKGVFDFVADSCIVHMIASNELIVPIIPDKR